MKKQIATAFVVSMAMAWAGIANAVPWYAPKGLPTKGIVTDHEAAEIVTDLLNVQFYPDTEDDSLYYILPVFHADVGTVAGTRLVNLNQIERRKEIVELNKTIGMEETAARRAIEARWRPDLDQVNKLIVEARGHTPVDEKRLATLLGQKREIEELINQPPAFLPGESELGGLLEMSGVHIPSTAHLADGETEGPIWER